MRRCTRHRGTRGSWLQSPFAKQRARRSSGPRLSRALVSSAADALRAALEKLKGNQLIGVINSIGKRRDAKASPALARMLYGSDANVARAAAAALGSIGGVSSVKELQAKKEHASPAQALASPAPLQHALLMPLFRPLPAADRVELLPRNPCKILVQR